VRAPSPAGTSSSGGTLSIAGGAVLVDVGLDRREGAVRAYDERHPGAAQRP
jgi:hypothetical protein